MQRFSLSDFEVLGCLRVGGSLFNSRSLSHLQKWSTKLRGEVALVNIIGLIHSLSRWKEEMLVIVSAEIRSAALIRPLSAWLGRS